MYAHQNLIIMLSTFIIAGSFKLCGFINCCRLDEKLVAKVADFCLCRDVYVDNFYKMNTVWRKFLTVENIDEFPAIRQYFPYQNFPFS